MIERSAKHYDFGPIEIYMNGGDPNFATPAHIRDAALKASVEGYTHYYRGAARPSQRERPAIVRMPSGEPSTKLS